MYKIQRLDYILPFQTIIAKNLKVNAKINKAGYYRLNKSI